MHTAIMYLLCELWNRDWEDKLILSQQAVVSTFMHTSMIYISSIFFQYELLIYISSIFFQYQLLDPKCGTGKLAEELGPQNPKQANLVCYLFSFGDIVIYIAEFYNGIFPPQIFIPIVHLKHWFLIVVSHIKSTIYILNSLPSESRVSVISSIISTLKKQLQQSTAGSDYSTEVLLVQPQENTYSLASPKYSLLLLLLLLLLPHFYG